MNSPSDKSNGQDHDVVLSSDRLLLRALQLSDAEAIYAAVCESKAELSRWLPWCHADYAISDTIEFLKGRPGAHCIAGEYAFAIVERDSRQFVGATGINQYDPIARRANLGYWLRTRATGRGFATEATTMVACWVFEHLDVERIEIVAAVENHQSQRVAARAGATREGIARKRLRVGQDQRDAVVFSLVRGDAFGENCRPERSR